LHIERDGTRLFFTTLGSGPDVVLLHPTPVDHRFWLPLANFLADSFRLVLIDLRGHGQSSSGDGAITMEKLAEDVHAVLCATGIERAAFVGCSIGGYVLYEYWRRFPNEMTALVPICGKPQADSAVSREKRQETMRAAQQPNGLGKVFRLMTETLIGPTAQKRAPEIRKIARDMMDAMSLDTFIAVQRCLMARPDAVPTLETIRVPVCAMAGGEDQTSTAAEMQIIPEMISDAEFHLLPDAGHYAPLEQPENTARILRAFLDRIFAARSKEIKSTVDTAH